MKIKTRFAPSPTGFFHVGSARTALFAYLFARSQEGEFILRIEDTDRERSTDEATQIILEGMAWLGLEHDGEITYQTKRFDRYKAVIDQLLESGNAYRCYCSKERLEKLRATQMSNKENPRYDGCCRELTEKKDAPFVVRFKNPESGAVEFDDMIRGRITVNNSELDDLILARTDGTPTYNFTVVVDDADMDITHVLRGDDHLSNTPKQINLFNALGVNPPVYGHLPMIHGDDGKKLSKRHGAVSVLEYREDGYLPEALLNYLVRLGWSCGDQEIFSKQDMIALFDVKNISRSPAVFNHEKLLWLNQHYIKSLNRHDVAAVLKPHLLKRDLDVSQGPELIDLVALLADRAKTLEEMADMSRYFYQDVKHYDEKAAKKFLTTETAAVFEALLAKFSALEHWEREALHEVIKGTSTELNLGMGKVAQPIRVAVTGSTISPSIDATLALLGREKTLQRLEQALLCCKKA
ncbi:MAG: glutamate--tRNA ligase [Legionellaceae bacterium]|nr:glutamate--tRNA ligase [Legionellaceae bacterium]